MIELPPRAPMSEYQRYIHQLEILQGGLTADLCQICLYLDKDLGKLFTAIRQHESLLHQTEKDPSEVEANRTQLAEELVDILNHLLALANRLEIDLESAFRRKNAFNQQPTRLA